MPSRVSHRGSRPLAAPDRETPSTNRPKPNLLVSIAPFPVSVNARTSAGWPEARDDERDAAEHQHAEQEQRDPEHTPRRRGAPPFLPRARPQVCPDTVQEPEVRHRGQASEVAAHEERGPVIDDDRRHHLHRVLCLRRLAGSASASVSSTTKTAPMAASILRLVLSDIGDHLRRRGRVGPPGEAAGPLPSTIRSARIQYSRMARVNSDLTAAARTETPRSASSRHAASRPPPSATSRAPRASRRAWCSTTSARRPACDARWRTSSPGA